MLHTVYHKFDKGARGKVSKIIFDEINRKLSGIVFETLSVGLRPPPFPEGKAFLFHGRTAKFVVKSKAETAPYAGAHQQKGRSTLDIQQLSNFVMTNLLYITGGLGVLVIVMYAIIINLALNVSYMKKRYRKMMTGVDGQNLERMLIGHIEEMKQVVEDQKRLDAENKTIEDLLAKALTRVGVVRFRAFDDMGSDLSYAVALLDSDNNGIIFSSLFGREDSRSYVKPIEKGASTYTLTDEEQQALQKAMGSR